MILIRSRSSGEIIFSTSKLETNGSQHRSTSCDNWKRDFLYFVPYNYNMNRECIQLTKLDPVKDLKLGYSIKLPRIICY